MIVKKSSSKRPANHLYWVVCSVGNAVDKNSKHVIVSCRTVGFGTWIPISKIKKLLVYIFTILFSSNIQNPYKDLMITFLVKTQIFHLQTTYKIIIFIKINRPSITCQGYVLVLAREALQAVQNAWRSSYNVKSSRIKFAFFLYPKGSFY